MASSRPAGAFHADKKQELEQYPKGSALFINQGGYEAGYIRYLSISN
eukprot:COSAG01_NODE_6916_length_3441_cov_3.080790_4_plen_47_part_00